MSTPTTEMDEYLRLVVSTFEKRLKGRAVNAVYETGGWLRDWERKLYEEAKRLLAEAGGKP